MLRNATVLEEERSLAEELFYNPLPLTKPDVSEQHRTKLQNTPKN